MTTYPVEFYRRLEQKWAVASTIFSAALATRHHRKTKTKRTMNEDQSDEPAVVREPDED